MGSKRIEATAVVLSAVNADAPDYGNDKGMLDLVFEMAGSMKWRLDLEVRPVGYAPYRAIIVTKVKNRLGGVRGLLGQWAPTPGLEVPVLLDERDPGDVIVDWKRFAEAGGMKGP
jgi:hypothetical protein